MEVIEQEQLKNERRRPLRGGVLVAMLSALTAFDSLSAAADPSGRFHLTTPFDVVNGTPCSSEKHPARFHQSSPDQSTSSSYLHRVSHCTPSLPAPSLGATKVGDTTVSLIWNLPAGVTAFCTVV
jgi:hypothetical protein